MNFLKPLFAPQKNQHQTGFVHLAIDYQYRYYQSLPFARQYTLLSRANKLAHNLGQLGIPTIWAAMDFNGNRESFSKTSYSFNGKQWMDLHKTEELQLIGLRMHSKDYILTKTNCSAFSNASFHPILQAKKIGNVIISGLYTRACVITTICDTIEKNYGCIVSYDCLGDAAIRPAPFENEHKPEAHKKFLAHALDKRFSKIHCLTSQQIVQQLKDDPCALERRPQTPTVKPKKFFAFSLNR